MKRDALNVLEAYLHDLRGYMKAVESVGLIQRIDQQNLPPEVAEIIGRIVQAQLTPAKGATFLYSTVIVGMYGALEAYIEELVEDFVEELNECVQEYFSLPEKLVANHRRLSGILADETEADTYIGTLNTAKIVANLHSCLAGESSYKVNATAFSYHTANFRVPVIEKILVDAGAQNVVGTIKSDPGFKNLLDRLDPGAIDSFYRIDDLAERRNEIAHGYPSQLLAASSLAEYIDVLHAFCRAVYRCLVLSFMPYARSSRAQHLGKPYSLYRSGTVACFDVKKETVINLGDLLVAYSEGAPFRVASIISMQENGKPIRQVSEGEALKIGIGTDVKCRDRWDYWVLHL